MSKTKSCLLCGVGGQGTVLASRLIAFAAMQRGENVRTSETIGMAQRGGCVVSHVRWGDTIRSPLIPKHSAEVLVGFEPAEAVRCLDYLSPEGTVIVNADPVMPVTVNFGGAPYRAEEMLRFLKENAGSVRIVDGGELCRRCGSPKVLNIVLLTAACCSGMLGMTVEELRRTVEVRVNPAYRELNFRAIEETERWYAAQPEA